MIKSIFGSDTRRCIDLGKSRFSGLNERLALRRPNQLNAAVSLEDLGNLNSIGLHKLKGPLRAFWSIDINAQWRLVFKFRDGDAYEVHIMDPH